MITAAIRGLVGRDLASAVPVRRATTIAVCSQKGGVGKTTTAVNLGVALAQLHGKEVLLLDLDPQGHVEKALGAVVPEGESYTPLSRTLTARRGDVLDSTVPTAVEGLRLTPGDADMSETEGVLAAKIGREVILSRAIERARGCYDYIIIDCPPNLGTLTLNALCAAERVLVPCEMSVLALEGVAGILETVDTVNERLNQDLELLGVLFTRVDGRNRVMNQAIEEAMERKVGDRLLRTRIAVNTALNKAQHAGAPVFSFAPTSTGALRYAALAEELVRRLARED